MIIISKKDFVRLKMVFNEALYKAVEKQDSEEVEKILRKDYKEEIEYKFLKIEEKIDLKEIWDTYQKIASSDDFYWAL